jgi:adenosylcobyric acid synthase
MPAKALMIGGTASHVGKSWTATAICRWLYRQGIKVAPFKAQNMSNNSYPCVGGGEIGRAQVAQAHACGLEPSPDMNPILLKPTSNVGSQVVVQGKVWKNLQAREYYEHHDFLRKKVHESYARLASQFEFIVVEGAGSIAELNLRQTDLVNIGFAKEFNVPILLVADIDRGGVFASLYGTIALLEPAERELVRAFAINRFRGDPSLFSSGVKTIEEKTSKPCLGVFPFLPDIDLDQEDSVSLDTANSNNLASNIAIIRFPHIANHTDFRLLKSTSWIQQPVDRQFEAVILPGTKSTMTDLQWFRAQGLETWLRVQHANGAKVVGICGGYQMLGTLIEDPDHVESEIDRMEGIGLLPVQTKLLREKVTTTVKARTQSGIGFSAYEIHMGETVPIRQEDCFAYVQNIREGISCNHCIGSYLHGAFENADVVEEYLGIRIPRPADREHMFDRLADWFSNAANHSVLETMFT